MPVPPGRITEASIAGALRGVQMHGDTSNKYLRDELRREGAIAASEDGRYTSYYLTDRGREALRLLFLKGL